jgi:hypothetical protein
VWNNYASVLLADWNSEKNECAPNRGRPNTRVTSRHLNL